MKRNAFCGFCDSRAPLLVPVRFYVQYGGAEVHSAPLCLSCRLNWRDDQYATLATTIEHAPKRTP